MLDGLQTAVTILCIVTALALFRRFFALDEGSSAGPPPGPDEAARYRTWMGWEFLGSILSFVLWGAVFGTVLSRMASGVERDLLRGAVVGEFSGGGVWWISAAVLAGAASLCSMRVVLRMTLGTALLSYDHYYEKCYRFRARSVSVWLCVALVVVAVVSYAGGAQWYTVAGDDGVLVGRPPSSRPVRRTYEQVSGVFMVDKIRAPNGQTRSEPHLVVEFSDGATVNSWTSFGNSARGREVLEYIAVRSGHAPRPVEFFPPSP